ncbi:MAG: Abi family protein [Alphaproteobacteria bacterium]|nr:Abi family protein [Alphaproteobacteria bacterium]
MNNLTDWHSSRKVDSYRDYVKDQNNQSQIESLYLLNQQLTYLIFPVLSNFELLFRNKIYQFLESTKQVKSSSLRKLFYKIMKFLGNNKQITHFWYEGILQKSCYSSETKKIIKEQLQEYKEKEKSLNKEILKLEKGKATTENIEKINRKISRKKKKLSNLEKANLGHLLVSDLSFGVWCNIVKDCHLKDDLLISLNLYKNNKNKYEKDWISYFFRIKNLRNRCCHHENIIKSLNEFFDVYNNCINLLEVIGGSKYKKHTYSIAVKVFSKDIEIKYLDILII